MIAKPNTEELNEYSRLYIDQIYENNLLHALLSLQKESTDLFSSIASDKEDYRYAENKWSIKQLLNHIIDCERIFSYRALCIARMDQTLLPSFDENLYASNDGSEERSLKEYIEEFNAVRNASIVQFKNISKSYIDNKGTANQTIYTPRILGWMIAGHNSHHIKILIQLYLTNNS